MLLGIDIGGTFTDGFYTDEQGKTSEVKVLSTPQDMFVGGFFDCLEEIAKINGRSVEELLAGVRRFTHGSTIATNIVIEDTGARVGMITTRGHRDVLKAMLGEGRMTGRPIDDVYNFLLPRPDPILSEDFIVEVSERVDYKGEAIVALNEEEAGAAVEELLQKDIDTLAVCFLWSFLNPEHEQKVKEIARGIKPDLFVSCSCDVFPILGEYQRFTATVINCMVQPESAHYMEELQERLKKKYGYDKQVNIMGCNKGIRPWRELKDVPVFMMDSGPVGGLCAAEAIANHIEEPNVIACDMGGTSFDLGIIAGGASLMKDTSVVGQWEYAIPKCDVESIGAGGGSIVSYDEEMKTVRVGPRSAGSRPGPVCYGLGGDEPTVSDADLLLNYLNPEIEIAGKKLDRKRAEEALAGLGERIGKGPEAMAIGAFNLVNELMAGRIRSEMINRGLDYRRFMLMSYGGAGPVHMTEVAKIIGIGRCLVPANASILSARGLCSADFRIEGVKEVDFTEPWDAEAINQVFDELKEETMRRVYAAAGGEVGVELEGALAMQFKGQFYQLEVPVKARTFGEDDLEEIRESFVRMYNTRYGEASYIPGATVNILCAKVGCVGKTAKLALDTGWKAATVPKEAVLEPRKIYDRDADGFISASSYRGELLKVGNKIEGPALIDFAHTTVRLGSREKAVVDANRNLSIEIKV